MNVLSSCCGACFGWQTLVEDPLEAPDRPEVKLDPLNMGLDAVIVKNGTRLCGTGGVIANAPIMQDKAYFEGIKICFCFCQNFEKFRKY